MKENILAKISANVVSVVLHPFLVVLYSVSLLFAYTNLSYVFADQIYNLLLPVFVFSFFLPSLFTILFWKLGYVGDLTLSNNNDCVFPYLIFITSTLCLTYFYYTTGIYLWFVGLMLSFSLVSLVGFVINFFWKISPYALSIGALIGGVLSISYNVRGISPIGLFMILFIIAGLLGVTRLYLNKDTPAQIYTGFAVGLIISYFTVLFSVYMIFLVL